MASHGKQKGASFERVVCKELSLWISGGKQKDLFWRSAMSGGRATLGFARGEKLSRQAGDISAVHPDGHQLTDAYYVECKFYRDLELGAFLEGRGKLARFWAEADKGARKHDRAPLLIAKQNITPTLVLVRAGCPLDLPRLVTWRSESKRGGDIALMWLSTLLKHKFTRIEP